MLQSLRTIDHNSPKKKSNSKDYSSRQKRISDIHKIYDGEIKIYRTTLSGDVYQMQMYVPAEKRYIRKSLKTRDKEIAVERAKTEFHQYKTMMGNGVKIFSVTAEEFRKRYLEYVSELVTSSQISKGRETNIKTFTKHWMTFVKEKTKVQNIDKKYFQGYRAFRQSMKSDITMTVVQNESISINQMYRWGIKEGLIAQNYEPDFGKIRANKNEVRRESYSVKDVKRLMHTSNAWREQAEDFPKKRIDRERDIHYRRVLQCFIDIMIHFGFRTGELLNLKFKDVEIHNDWSATITIRAENTKVRNKREVTGRVGYSFALLKHNFDFNSDEDFIFKDYKSNKILGKKNLYSHFNSLIKFTKEKYPNFNDKNSLYSLRHFWITTQLLLGKVDVYKIARYAGTSLTQIQKHYDNVKDKQVSEEIVNAEFFYDQDNRIVQGPKNHHFEEDLS